MTISSKSIAIIGVFFGFLGVAFGAFGAHGIEEMVKEWYPTIEEQTKRLDQWNTGVRYHFYHALAILAIAAISIHQNNRSFQIATWFFVGGILLFSGSLYLLTVTGVGILGAIAAIGGTLFLIGWIMSFVGVINLKIPAQNHLEQD